MGGFGSNPEAYLITITHDMSFDDIRQAGYVVGVKDIAIKVNKDEMLVIMVLPEEELIELRGVPP